MESNESKNLNTLFVYPPPSHPLPPPAPAPQLPSFGQLQATRQPTPPRQYTTVGSLYNPQPQPLQPPVRRGRTVKSLFPYKSDSPAAPPQLQYTPLQQNSDRAISPIRSDYGTGTVPLLSFNSFQERQDAQSFGPLASNVQQASNMSGVLQASASGNTETSRGVNNQTAGSMDSYTDYSAADGLGMLAKPGTSSDHGSDTTDTKPISAMNFNSLTNLASYPNPNRRAAQKLLASHRPNPVPDSQFLDSQLNPCGFEPEPSPSASEFTGAYMYRSSFSRVRGAPAPLTAGPPGLRQHKPSTFEQETLQRAREFDDENLIMNPVNPYLVHTSYGQHVGASSVEDGSVSSNLPMETTKGSQDEDEGAGKVIHRNRDMDWIVDTLTADDAKRFYPDGLPKNFNLHTQPISAVWDIDRLGESEQCPYYQEKKLVERKRLVNSHFYSGAHTFNKSFVEAKFEHTNRSVAHLVGRPYQERRFAEGRIENPHLGVREASRIPTPEHAQPLLSKALQGVMNLPDLAPYSRLPKFEHSLWPHYLQK